MTRNDNEIHSLSIQQTLTALRHQNQACQTYSVSTFPDFPEMVDSTGCLVKKLAETHLQSLEARPWNFKEKDLSDNSRFQDLSFTWMLMLMCFSSGAVVVMVWQWSPSCFNIIPRNISLDELIPGCFFSTSIQPLLTGVQVAGRTGSQGHFWGSPKMEVQLFIGFCFDNFHGTFLSIVQELWSFYDLAWCFHSEHCLCCKEICALFLCKNQHILLHQFPGCWIARDSLIVDPGEKQRCGMLLHCRRFSPWQYQTLGELNTTKDLVSRLLKNLQVANTKPAVSILQCLMIFRCIFKET